MTARRWEIITPVHCVRQHGEMCGLPRRQWEWWVVGSDSAICDCLLSVTSVLQLVTVYFILRLFVDLSREWLRATNGADLVCGCCGSARTYYCW